MKYKWAALVQNSWFVALLITRVMQYIVPGERYYLWSVRYTCASLIFQHCLMISDRSKAAFHMQHSRPLEVGRYHASERFCSFFKLHTWLKVRCKCQVHSDNSENSNYQNVSVAHRKFDSNHCEVFFFYVIANFNLSFYEAQCLWHLLIFLDFLLGNLHYVSWCKQTSESSWTGSTVVQYQ